MPYRPDPEFLATYNAARQYLRNNRARIAEACVLYEPDTDLTAAELRAEYVAAVHEAFEDGRDPPELYAFLDQYLVPGKWDDIEDD